MRISLQSHGKYLGVLITFIALFAVAFLFDFEVLRGYIERAGVWAPVLFILLKISTIVFAPLSGGPLYPLVGAFFGFFPGILYALIGDFIGYTIAFMLSRHLGHPIVRKLTAGHDRTMIARIVSHVGTAKGFLQACLALGFAPDLLSYGAGLSRLPYPIFIAIIMPLSAVVSTILVLFGSALGGGSDITYALMLPVGAIALMLVGGYFFLRAILKKDLSSPPEL